MFYAGSASLIRRSDRIFGGIYLFPSVIWTAYGMMYDFADLIFVVNGTLGALSILAAILCCGHDDLPSLRGACECTRGTNPAEVAGARQAYSAGA